MEEKVARFVGLDIGKWKCRVAFMNQAGQILDEFWFTSNHEGIERKGTEMVRQKDYGTTLLISNICRMLEK